MKQGVKRPPYTAGILGLGRIAWKLEQDPQREKPATHAGALARCKEVRLAGCWDSDPEARKEFSRSPWGRRVRVDFSSVQEFLAEVKPDLVCIATWPDSHLALTQVCVDAGVRVVVCEKPLALTLEDAQGLAALEGQGAAKTRILVNHERRYARDWTWLKETLEAQPYGPVLSFTARLYLGRTRAPAVTLLHDGTHLVDILAYLFGGPWAPHFSQGDPLKAPGTWHLLGSCGEVPGTLEVGSGRDHMVFEVEVHCAQGRLVCGNGVLQVQESKPAAWAKGFRSLAPGKAPRFPQTHYFLNMMKDAVQTLLDPAHTPRSTAQAGLEALQAIKDSWTLAGLDFTQAADQAPDGHKPAESKKAQGGNTTHPRSS